MRTHCRERRWWCCVLCVARLRHLGVASLPWLHEQFVHERLGARVERVPKPAVKHVRLPQGTWPVLGVTGSRRAGRGSPTRRAVLLRVRSEICLGRHVDLPDKAKEPTDVVYEQVRRVVGGEVAATVVDMPRQNVLVVTLG